MDSSGKPPLHPKPTPLQYSKGIAFGPNRRTRRSALRPQNAKRIRNTFYKKNRPTRKKNTRRNIEQYYKLQQESVFPNQSLNNKFLQEKYRNLSLFDLQQLQNKL
jgi:hypothetical protein